MSMPEVNVFSAFSHDSLKAIKGALERNALSSSRIKYYLCQLLISLLCLMDAHNAFFLGVVCENICGVLIRATLTDKRFPLNPFSSVVGPLLFSNGKSWKF